MFALLVCFVWSLSIEMRFAYAFFLIEDRRGVQVGFDTFNHRVIVCLEWFLPFCVRGNVLMFVVDCVNWCVCVTELLTLCWFRLCQGLTIFCLFCWIFSKSVVCASQFR